MATLGTAQAGVFNETEPNNSLAAAQVISDPGSSQLVINGTRTFGDASDDFYRFMVSVPGALSITSTSSSGFADSIMGLFGPNGSLLASNDDAGPSTSMSAITFQVIAAGMYTIGFSGFNAGLLSCAGTVTSCYDSNDDFAFDTFVAGGGEGGSTGWSYTITANQTAAAIPEPDTYLLFGIGMAMVPLVRRRARRSTSCGKGAAQ
nr:PPC domain-containing protein [Schlegelella koreensis]